MTVMNRISQKLLWASLAAAVIFSSCGGNSAFPPQGVVDPETPEEVTPAPNKTRLSTAADFLAFAEAVNNQDGTEKEDIYLERDVDLSSISDWTPAGNGGISLVSGTPEVSGPMFQGRFHGQGHRIRYFKPVSKSSEKGAVFGLFGILGPGATVEDLGFESSCSLTAKSSSELCAEGLLAGVVCDAAVRNVTSAAPLRIRSAGAPSGATHYAGLVGCLLSRGGEAELSNISCNGKISSEGELSGCSFYVAPIVGASFASEASSATISDCINEGAVESSLSSTAGICAVARGTAFNNCFNKASLLGSCAQSGSCIGGIAAECSENCTFTDCRNWGDVTSTTSSLAAGVVCLPGDGTFTRCANYSAIRTDNSLRGVFWANAEAETVWTDCIADGSVGAYGGGDAAADNYPEAEVAKYLGMQKTGSEASLSGINYLVRILKGVEPKLKIFFIGNSFTKDAVEHLPGLLAAAGIKEFKLCHMYYGGRTVDVYNDYYSTKTDYRCYTAENGSTTWVETTGKSLHSVAASDDWDIVTIQEYSGKEVAWNWTDDRKSDLEGLISKVKADCPEKTPDFYFIMSQAFWDFSILPTPERTMYQNYFTTTEGMWEVVCAATQKLMAAMPQFKDVIATGTYLQNMRGSSLQNSMGLSRDGYHMDYGIGRYGAACMLFEKLISPSFDNILLDNNTYRYSFSSTSTSGYSTPVTDANAPLALKAARAALSQPYKVTKIE